MSKRYTDEDLARVVANNASYRGVLRGLGIKQAGGSQSHITRRVKQLGLDACYPGDLEFLVRLERER